jgi:hypothetical protein
MTDILRVSYFSGGVSSAVATKLMIQDIDRIFYTHIDDQHPDTMRFVKECEEWFEKQVEIMQSPLKSVEQACRSAGFIRHVRMGAACTTRLKRRVRKKFEDSYKGNMSVVWGLDVKEKDRCERLRLSMPEHQHIFPLVDRELSKEQSHKILSASGIKRPEMYNLGYQNNNCIGCVKGGMGYWNKIRVDFPDVFANRSQMERDIGFAILGHNNWLSELDPDRGRKEGPIVEDCGIMCELLRL